MRRLALFMAVAAPALAGYLAGFGPATSQAGQKESMISHDVYFTLKDNSPAARQLLVDSCRRYLARQPGIVFFAAGTRNKDREQAITDRDFDVALHIVFQDLAAYDQYMEADRHKKFIADHKDNWKIVRVFDATVTQ